LNGGHPLTESDFAQQIDGASYIPQSRLIAPDVVLDLDDSISGSASSSDEDDSAESDTVAALMNKTKRVNMSPSPTAGSRPIPQSALAWFHSPPATQIGVYKALFSNHIQASSQLSELRNMQARAEGGHTWAMFMVAGGHFAGAVVRVSRPDEDDENEDENRSKRKKPKRPKPDTEVLKHKTFHRYTS
jgi:hypothetical protein